MSKRVAAIIQARTGSRRLPRKVLLDLEGMTVLERVVERVALSETVDTVVVATTMEEEDLAIVGLCAGRGIRVYCGSEEDVLDRYYQAARLVKADHVVRITSDCPVIDGAVIDLVVREHLEGRRDYTSNTLENPFPDGEDVEVFTFKALERAWVEAVLASEREHVTPYIKKHPELFSLRAVQAEEGLGAKRWALDEERDYRFLTALYGSLYGENPRFGMKEILDLLARNPELEEINRGIARDEGYGQSLAEDRAVPAGRRREGAPGAGTRLYEKARALIPGGTQLLSKRPEMILPERWPSYYSRAEGCTVWDLEGREFLDMSYMGVGSCLLGYCDEEVDGAVVEAVGRGNLTTLNVPEEVQLAEVLCRIHPWADKVRYARTGGEAMAMAVRIARAKTGKDRVLFCGYHGWHDWYLAANIGDPQSLEGHLLPGLDPRGVPRALAGSAFPFTYNDTAEFLDLLDRHGKQTGAVVVETVRNFQPAPGFFEALREATRDRGIILVLDEITAGFRFCHGGAHLGIGIEPDLAVFAKAMSNGYPMAAVIGRGECMEAAQETFISSLFWTDRIGPAAALATIGKLERVSAAEQVGTIGRKVQAGWKAAAAASGLSISVAGTPPLAHFVFEHDEPLVMKTLFTQEMLKRGFLATTAFYASCAHGDGQVDAYLAAAGETFRDLAAMAAGGKAANHLEGPVCHAGFRRLT